LSLQLIEFQVESSGFLPPVMVVESRKSARTVDAPRRHGLGGSGSSSGGGGLVSPPTARSVPQAGQRLPSATDCWQFGQIMRPEVL